DLESNSNAEIESNFVPKTPLLENPITNCKEIATNLSHLIVDSKEKLSHENNDVVLVGTIATMENSPFSNPPFVEASS
ncbi:hypothetical protein KI387_036492, partial [Taxus chinensis]